MKTIPAIETTYNGVRFRSRLEARWAVFFDSLGVRWEYEREGYELPSGRYLPDFFLTRYSHHFEVKGEEPSDLEIALCVELGRETKRSITIGVGDPAGCVIDWNVERGPRCIDAQWKIGEVPADIANGFAAFTNNRVAPALCFRCRRPETFSFSWFTWSCCDDCWMRNDISAPEGVAYEVQEHSLERRIIKEAALRARGHRFWDPPRLVRP